MVRVLPLELGFEFCQDSRLADPTLTMCANEVLKKPCGPASYLERRFMLLISIQN